MSRFFSQLTNFCTPSRRHRKKLTAAGDHFSPSLPRRSAPSSSGHSQMQRSVSMMTIWEEPAAIVHKSQLKGMERGISEEENEGYETASALSPEYKGRKSPRKGRKKNEQEQGGSG